MYVQRNRIKKKVYWKAFNYNFTAKAYFDRENSYRIQEK